MKCPSCAAPIEGERADCPACGVILAKALEKRRREAEAAEAAFKEGPAKAPSPWGAWIGKGIAAALFLAWLGAWLLYAASEGRKGVRIPGEDEPPAVEVRDDSTGELRRLEVREAAPQGGGD